MKRAVINPSKCKNCQACKVILQCPNTATFREEDFERPWVDSRRCSGCMKCKMFCHGSAIE